MASGSSPTRMPSENAPRSRGSMAMMAPQRLAGATELAPYKELQDHLGIGLALEPHPLLAQLLLQFLIVLDDAVVHQRDILVGMRVGIGGVGNAVRRPAGVAEA